MKKTIFILIFIACQLYTYSQGFDLIVTTKGESIVCRTDSITDTHIYFAMVVRDKWVHTHINRSMVSEFQPYDIYKDIIVFEKDSSIFIKDKARIKIYKTWVSLNNEPFKIKGVLYELKDSSISISSSVVIEDYIENNFETMNLHIYNIKSIQTRRKNSIGRGIWIGAVSGFATGGLLTLLYGVGDFWDFHDGTLMAGVPLAVIGAGIGALVGSIKIEIPINGSMDRYNLKKKKLKKYSLQ